MYKPKLFSASTKSSGSGEALRKREAKKGEECIFITSNDDHITISTARLLWLYSPQIFLGYHVKISKCKIVR
jgi:hypothetical protein